ncbi:MAG: hypothetical protein AB8B91_10705 [Rubripirellula sp.]
MPKRLPNFRRSRTGATLIDVAVGSMLLSVLLIPSIHLMSESRTHNRRFADRDVLLYEAEQLLEVTKVSLSEPTAFDAAYSTTTDAVGKIPITDGSTLTSRIRVSADTSLPAARLLTITADVWIDTDANSRITAGELSQTLRTQWAAPQ